jgi:hypothetical protein
MHSRKETFVDIAFLKQASHHELLSLYDALLCELRSRGITRSSNNPVADYTEWLASRALGLTLETKSTTGFDGICVKGLKYEVKGRRRTPQNDSTQLSQIRGLDKRHFDYLIGVIYRPDFSVDYAAQIPYEVVVERAKYREHTNASILQLKPDIFGDVRVLDITQAIIAASRIIPLASAI